MDENGSPPAATAPDPRVPPRRDAPEGWIQPGRGEDTRRRRSLMLGCGIGGLIMGVVLLAGPLIAAAILGPSGVWGSSGPGIQTVGFGTGGSECTLTNAGRSFPEGIEIRNVVTFSPALAAGGTITIKVERNGTELAEHRETVRVTEPTDCIYGTFAPLEAGHYRVELTISPSPLPPISGEFDVTPA